MNEYRRALTLLQEAAQLMDSAGDTLIAAHIATPLAMVESRLHSETDVTDRAYPPCG